MTVAEALSAIRRAGTVERHRDDLVVRVPANARSGLEPALAALRSHKAEALTLLPRRSLIDELFPSEPDLADLARATAALNRAESRLLTAIVGVDHTRKMPGDVIDAVIGTTGTTAGCDAVIGMARTPNGDTVLTARGREHEELTYALRFDATPGSFGWGIFGSGDDAQTSAAREEIKELLRNEGPLSPAKAALLLRKNVNTVRSTMWRMATAGQVTKQGNAYVLAARSASETQ